MIENYLCPIAKDCLFYTKPYFISKEESLFYVDFCLNGGNNGEQECGLKRNWERTNELRKTIDFPRDKRTWRSK